MVRVHLTKAIAAAAIVLLVAAGAAAQDDTEQARKVYAEVNAGVAKMTRTAFIAQRPDVEYRSNVLAWADASGLRKVQATDEDDDGEVVTEYYYSGGTLLFVYQAIKGYTEDGRLVTRLEERQYFREGGMFRWLSGKEKAANDPATAEFREEGATRLAASKFYGAAAKHEMSRPAGDFVKVGSERKWTGGIVTNAEAGDAACYLTLRDEYGILVDELADFSICEMPDLAGKRVRLHYEMGNVMADECQGDPECTKTRRAALVKKIDVLGK